jgi:predicted nucleic acid-binding protein
MGQKLIMVESILLDTDILVDFFRGHGKAVAFVNTHSARIILSSIVVAELYAGVKGDAEQAALENSCQC